MLAWPAVNGVLATLVVVVVVTRSDWSSCCRGRCDEAVEAVVYTNMLVALVLEGWLVIAGLWGSWFVR